MMASYSANDLGLFFDGWVERALAVTPDDSRAGADLSQEMRDWLGSGYPVTLDLQDWYPEDLSRDAEDAIVSDCKTFLDRAWPIIVDVMRDRKRIGGAQVVRAAGRSFFDASFFGAGDAFRLWPHDAASKLRRIAEKFAPMALTASRNRVHVHAPAVSARRAMAARVAARAVRLRM